MSTMKLILVIGATGAQGMVAIDGPRERVPCPYKIRAAPMAPERKPSRPEVLNVSKTFEDFLAVAKTMDDGAYGARRTPRRVNRKADNGAYPPKPSSQTRSCTKSTRAYGYSRSPTRRRRPDIISGVASYGARARMRRTKSHWTQKRAGYDPRFQAEYLNAVGRVTALIKAMPSTVSGDTALSWSGHGDARGPPHLPAVLPRPPDVLAGAVRRPLERSHVLGDDDAQASQSASGRVGSKFDHRAGTSGPGPDRRE
ncbi:hypothetical protein K438DRAFT_899904 [Mycena galopus ATCC 62051]|nr:hypothetical protein K438DRAFT_899904 [Mycena galopus ATCC 62051]